MCNAFSAANLVSGIRVKSKARLVDLSRQRELTVRDTTAKFAALHTKWYAICSTSSAVAVGGSSRLRPSIQNIYPKGFVDVQTEETLQRADLGWRHFGGVAWPRRHSRICPRPAGTRKRTASISRRTTRTRCSDRDDDACHDRPSRSQPQPLQFRRRAARLGLCYRCGQWSWPMAE